MKSTINPASIGARIGKDLQVAPVPLDPGMSFMGLASWQGVGARVRWAMVTTTPTGEVLTSHTGEIPQAAQAAEAAPLIVAEARRHAPPGRVLLAVNGAHLLEAADGAPWDVHGLDPALPQTRALLALRETTKEADRADVSHDMTPLVVATDASKSRGGRVAGLGVVTAEGKVVSRAVEAHRIADAEAFALAVALRHVWRARGRSLILESDSTTAVDALHDVITGGASTPTRRVSAAAARALAEGYRHAAAQGPVAVRWVKGHAGHTLNELADRVAQAARRAHEAASTDVLEGVCRQVKMEASRALLGTDCADVALAA